MIDFQMEIEAPSPSQSLGKIVHVSGGDLWLLDLDTNQHTRLTRDGYNRFPCWSADGRLIAYLKQGNLFVLDLDNKREDLITDNPVSEFTWSPLENWLFYLNGDGVQVWREDQERSSTLLIGVNKYLPIYFSLNPFNSSIAIEAQGIDREIRVMNLDSMKDLPFYKEPDSSHVPHLSGWSPDGLWLLAWVGPQSSIAVSAGLPLCALPVRGGQHICTNDKVLVLPDFVSWSFPHQLIFVAGEGHETWFNKGLAGLDLDGMNVKWLVKPEEQAVSFPAWSPDGQRIAYSASPVLSPSEAHSQRDAALAGRRIWVIDVMSGRKTQLTRDNQYQDERPLWSSDGKHILFARISEIGASLWLMEADGGSIRQMVDELTPRPDPQANYGYIDWSAWYDWWRPGAPPESVCTG